MGTSEKTIVLTSWTHDRNSYTPSIAVGILGVVLFIVALGLHLWLLLRYRTWYFSTVLVLSLIHI